MGRRGPARVPNKVLEARGSWRAKARSGGPQVEVGIPDCPAWVSSGAKKYWPDIAGELAGLGVMGKPYAISLGLLIDALAMYLQAKKGGNSRTAALWWEKVLKASKEFGMTPASVSAVQVSGGGKGKNEEASKKRFFQAG
jgi:phage terminase small subunit